jgi:hypothetical protein
LNNKIGENLVTVWKEKDLIKKWNIGAFYFELGDGTGIQPQMVHSWVTKFSRKFCWYKGLQRFGSYSKIVIPLSGLQTYELMGLNGYENVYIELKRGSDSATIAHTFIPIAESIELSIDIAEYDIPESPFVTIFSFDRSMIVTSSE